MQNGQSKDRRVRRTRSLLHGALGSLIHERGYDAIVVKEILARADVGRSTFYAHFRNKDELLESGIRDVLRTGEITAPTRTTSPAERVLRFSLPVFEHVERHRGAGDTSLDARQQAVVHEHLGRVLVELIAEDLRRVGQRDLASGNAVPRELLARHVVSTLLLVLSWWAESEEPLPATKVNDLFRTLILAAVTEVVGT